MHDVVTVPPHLPAPFVLSVGTFSVTLSLFNLSHDPPRPSPAPLHYLPSTTSLFLVIRLCFSPWIKGSSANPSSCGGLYKNSTVEDKRLLKIIPALGFPISQRFTSLGSLNLPDMEYWIWGRGSVIGSFFFFLVVLFLPFQDVCSVNAVLLDPQDCYSASEENKPLLTSKRNRVEKWRRVFGNIERLHCAKLECTTSAFMMKLLNFKSTLSCFKA